MSEQKWIQFESYLKEAMQKYHIPGCAVAVSQHGKVLFQKGFGFCDQMTKAPVTENSIFGIASVTKSFTALAIIMLEDEGLLSVNDPVIKYLPNFKLIGVEDMSSIKIYHLLTHTTGLAPMFRREELNKLKDHLTYLAEKDYEMLGKPGEYFSYCNDTFLLLGAIIEKVAGKLYRRHITEKILNPLKMYRSTFSIDELAKYDDVTIPYEHNKQTNQLEEKLWPKLGNYEVGGGVRSTVLDLLKYGEFYVTNENDAISRETLKRMWENPFEVANGTFYGYAFKVTPNYNSVTLVEHGGGQPGVSSNFGFIPEEGIVVSVLCNVSNVPADEIWLAAMNTALGLPMDMLRKVEPTYHHSEAQLEKLVGTYDCSEGGKASIVVDNNQPILEINGESFSLRGSSENAFVIEKSEKPITFFLKGDEKAWAVLVGSRMLTRKQSWVPRT